MIPDQQETEERRFACIGAFLLPGLPICAVQRDGGGA